MTDLTDEALDALVAQPESVDMLAFHLRNMADGSVDAIDAERLSRAATLVSAITDLRARCADHEAEVARLTAERDSATRAKDCFQRMTRAHWEALCAMRNSINEYIQMPNTDSGPLFSPEDGPIYADIAERVIADLAAKIGGA